jgi:hypothetical protein
VCVEHGEHERRAAFLVGLAQLDLVALRQQELQYLSVLHQMLQQQYNNIHPLMKWPSFPLFVD